jgi:hypothetical protein
MRSFKEFVDDINEESNESGAMKAIRNGVGIDKSFWDNFILLLNDPDSVSDLLNIPVEKIGTWRESITQTLDKVHRVDGEVIPKEKKRLLKTGLPEEI